MTDQMTKIKTAEQWAEKFAVVQFNDPACHGQMLPTPQTVKFFSRIQADALRYAANRCREHDGLSIMAADLIDRKAAQLEIGDTANPPLQSMNEKRTVGS